jgi:hypothetical protein
MGTLYPLHIKEVGALAWETVSRWLCSEHGELFAAFADHLKWFNDEMFLEQQTRALREVKKAEPIWSTLEDQDIETLLHRGRIREVSESYIRAWCVVFCVLELMKARRRFISAPELNDHSEDQVQSFAGVEVSTVEIAALAARTESAFTMDFPWFYGQMLVAPEAQKFYGFAHKSRLGIVRFFVLTSVPTGSRFVPLIAQTISVAISRSAVRAAAQTLKLTTAELEAETLIDVCIDNCRISGREIVTKAVAIHFETQCEQLGLTTNNPIGEIGNKYTFLGVTYNHPDNTVALGRNISEKLGRLRQEDWSTWTVRQGLGAFGMLVGKTV